MRLWRKYLNNVCYIGTRSQSPTGDIFTPIREATEEDHVDCMNGRISVWETMPQY